MSKKDIPADIWFDILLKVPAEDVAEFRRLSKVHRNLIDSPIFRRKHNDLSAHHHGHHVILSSGNKTHRVNLRASKPLRRLTPPIKHQKLCRLADVCMGILCYEIQSLGFEYFLLLWNPLTGSSRRISLEGKKRCPWRDPNYVLGYEDVTDDWKVLRMDFYPNDGLRVLEIYSLKTGSWRELRFEHEVGIQQPVFVEGTNSMHWCSRYYDTYRIVAYNLSTQNWNDYILPSIAYKPRNRCFHSGMSSLGGCLCVCVTYFGLLRLDVWTMKDYGVDESWTRLSISTQNVGYLNPPEVLCNSGSRLVLSSQGLYMYNLETSNVEKKLDYESLNLGRPKALVFTPTLRTLDY